MYIKCFALCLAHDKCSINGTNDDDDEEGGGDGGGRGSWGRQEIFYIMMSLPTAGVFSVVFFVLASF